MGARGVFITGTDTGCGKTRASLLLMAALKRTGRVVAGMKPVASGSARIDGRLVNDDAAQIRAACSRELPYEQVNPCALAEPVSPNFAAARAGRRVCLEPVLAAYAALARDADTIVVEGVGGWRVPLSDQLAVPDLVAALALPVILVVGLRLGCINHAQLTAMAVAADGADLCGWIANRVDPDYDTANETVDYLAGAIDVPLLGQIPFLDSAASAEAAAAGIDLSAAGLA